jgi:hypothetical protein
VFSQISQSAITESTPATYFHFITKIVEAFQLSQAQPQVFLPDASL